MGFSAGISAGLREGDCGRFCPTRFRKSPLDPLSYGGREVVCRVCLGRSAGATETRKGPPEAINSSGSQGAGNDRGGGDAGGTRDDDHGTEPNRGMRVGETKIGPLNDPND